ILNGDSTAHSFRDTGLGGDVLVWREVFSQGPLIEDISSGDFWKLREKWIGNTFSDDPDDYEKTVVTPLEKLKEPYDEINLWFEFDLHCQANMLGVMELLAKNTNLSPPNIFLICPDSFPGKSNFKGMGELNGEELEYLFDNIREELGESDFAIAAEAWKLYVAKNPDRLEKWLNETTFWGSLRCLKPAMEANIKRLRTNAEGLNYIEQTLLDIYNYGYKTKYEIYQRFWDDEKIYGMGDLEIDIYLKRLADKGLITLR
ncbi:MAG TPA: DUF1835 domain-containing protein, partial [Mucilaginibacter sp.]|nr:DUF1835 domain-containing protein [Mucilaginibacter sp.]